MADLGPSTTVDEHGAAVLLGISPPEVRWFSRVLGLGREQDGGGAQIVFTYEELKRLSSAAAASAK
jgi:hypothetical protein